MRTSIYPGRYTGSEDIHGLVPPALASVMHRFGRWRDARRLARLSDQSLKDLGLTRDGVDAAVHLGR